MIQPAVAGVARLPHAAVGAAGAVRDISDSGLIMRLTRGRGWIALLCALLFGIVALNVVSLSLNSGAGRLGVEIDELERQNSALRADLAEQFSASRVEAAAASLGLAVPDPQDVRYLDASDSDAEKLARLLATDTFLTSEPTSYATESYVPASYESAVAAPATTEAPAPAVAPAPASPAPAPAPSGGGGSPGATGGIGL